MISAKIHYPWYDSSALGAIKVETRTPTNIYDEALPNISRRI